MRHFIIIVVLSLFGFFVNFDFLGSIGNSVLKIFLFFGLSYILFLLYKDKVLEGKIRPLESEDQNPPAASKEISVENTLLSHNEESIVGLLNDKEFSLNSLVISQFEILYNFFIPLNGYVFLETNKQVRIFYKNLKTGLNWKESQETPHIIKLINNHKDDILVENNLNQQSRILPYYDDNYTPGSIFGLKIPMGKDQAFYFIFDVPENGFFNEEDFNVPVQISFAMQYMIKNALQLKELNKNFKNESTRLKLNEQLNRSVTQNDLISSYIEFLAEIFEAHKLTIALLDRNNKNIAEIIKTVGQLDSIKEGTRFAIDEGLCGKVILNNQVYLIEDIEKDGYFIPRFSKNEKTNFGLRSFLGIPLIVENDVVGMISMEHKIPNTYSKYHKDHLKNYTVYFEAALRRFAKKKGD